MKFESLQGPEDEEQGKPGQRVCRAPEANRTRLPNIYGTSPVCQAPSFAPYLREFVQQGAVEVGVAHLSISGRGNWGREGPGKLPKATQPAGGGTGI